MGRHPGQKNGSAVMPIKGRGRDCIENIILYDQRNKKIGNIYPRRAKQLVLKGRAAWLDEGRSLQMIPDVNDSSSETFKEETFMFDDLTCPTNGKPEEAVPEMSVGDYLLMYQAKQNVKNRKNLFKHVLAFIAAWPILGFFYATVFSGMTHPRNWHHINVVEQLYRLYPASTNEQQIFNDNIVHDVVNVITWYFRHGHTPDIWFVIVGAMLAWYGWIMIRVLKPVPRKIRSFFKTKDKPDPVMQEYYRLKDIAAGS